MKDLEKDLDIIFDKCYNDIKEVYKRQKDYIEIIHSLDGNNNEGKVLEHHKMFNEVYALVVMNTTEKIMWRFISMRYLHINRPYEDFEDVVDFMLYCDEQKEIDWNVIEYQ